MLCGDLEGWRGWYVWEGRGMCIHRADSLHCTAEANTTLWSIYTPIRKIKYVGFIIGYGEATDPATITVEKIRCFSQLLRGASCIIQDHVGKNHVGQEDTFAVSTLFVAGKQTWEQEPVFWCLWERMDNRGEQAKQALASLNNFRGAAPGCLTPILGMIRRGTTRPRSVRASEGGGGRVGSG